MRDADVSRPSSLWKACDGTWLPYGVVVMFAILLRCIVGLYPYSGCGSPPMYGDFEAQRHWMELTTNIPPSEWYTNSSSNDLMYWGIDYPPLSSYHSWLVGKMLIEPDMVRLFSSRGYETASGKFLMRMAALATDCCTFIPAAVVFAVAYQPSRSTGGRLFVLSALLLNPAYVLIDHGHFQFNCAMLGFVLVSILLVLNDNYVLGSVAFCLALNFKQMSLYFALPIFVFLLRSCWNRTPALQGAVLFCELGASVMSTFAVLWAPWLRSYALFASVVHRLFPVARGLYEDKVANVWVMLHPVLKLKFFPRSLVLVVSAAAVLLGLMPSCLMMFFDCGQQNFLCSLFVTSVIFFLFSFQVHEKTILLPLLPAVMLSLERPFYVGWLSTVAMFSMWPLLQKDGLAVPYAVLSLAFALFCCTVDPPRLESRRSWIEAIAFSGSTIGILSLHVAEIAFPPPARFPDLFPYLNSTFCCAHLLIAYVAATAWQTQQFLRARAVKTKED